MKAGLSTNQLPWSDRELWFSVFLRTSQITTRKIISSWKEPDGSLRFLNQLEPPVLWFRYFLLEYPELAVLQFWVLKHTQNHTVIEKIKYCPKTCTCPQGQRLYRYGVF
jgi:hypothetical protein